MKEKKTKLKSLKYFEAIVGFVKNKSYLVLHCLISIHNADFYDFLSWKYQLSKDPWKKGNVPDPQHWYFIF